MNRSTVDIPFLSEALSGEIIWVILKVANLNEEGLVIMTGREGEEEEKDSLRKVWWLQQEEKEKKEKKLIRWLA